jgi:hypothetical protein
MTRKLKKAIQDINITKTTKPQLIPGILGLTFGGQKQVEVPNHPGYVFVRVTNNQSEVIRAYNDQVSLVYGLPVLLQRDDRDRTRYRVAGRDIAKYQEWGSSPYLPRHGNSHSFVNGGGGDIVWVYGPQFMPALVTPSGSVGGNGVVMYPYSWEYGGAWHYLGPTGTSSLLGYNPTDPTKAKMVLLALNLSTEQLSFIAGSEFDITITGSHDVITNYLPMTSSSDQIPLAGIRLVSGTSVISWANIYDVRPFFTGIGSGGSGSSGGASAFTDLTDVPASYTGQAGKLVAVNNAEDGLEFRTNTGTSGGGGGGSSFYSIWDADAPPISTGTYDDEFGNSSFASGTAGGWSVYNYGGYLNISEGADRTLLLTMSSVTGSWESAGIYKAIPTSFPSDPPWTIWTKVDILSSYDNGSYTYLGIGLWDNAASYSAAFDMVGLRAEPSTDHGKTVLLQTIWSDHKTVSSTLGVSGLLIRSTIYLRVRFDGTYYNFDYSDDGIGWINYRDVTPVFTPSHFGIIMMSGTNGIARGRVHFFRYTNSDVGFDTLLNGRLVSLYS